MIATSVTVEFRRFKVRSYFGYACGMGSDERSSTLSKVSDEHIAGTGISDSIYEKRHHNKPIIEALGARSEPGCSERLWWRVLERGIKQRHGRRVDQGFK